MDESPASSKSRRSWWGGLVVAFAALVVVVAVVAVRWRGDDAVAPSVSLDDGSPPTSAGVEARSGSVARVEGQAFVEIFRPPPEPEPEVEVVIDPGGEVTARRVEPTATSEPIPEPGGPADARGGSGGTGLGPGGAHGSGGTGPGNGPPPLPPPVERVAPDAGSCTVIAWQRGRQVSEPTRCADDGRFEVALHPGEHGRTAFEVLVPGHLRAVLEVDVPASGRGRLPPVALGRAVSVRGLVVDGRGAPMPDIVVQAMPRPNLDEPEPWRAQTGADGTFEFNTLPPGPVSVRAEAVGHAVSVVEALAPQSELLITLQALVDLEGRVAGSTEALARARVRVEGSGIWPVREQPVDADGHFTLPRVPDGIYALEAIVEATAAGEPEFASIPLENVTPELAITLALVPAFRVPVEVRDPRGEPVAGARVTLSNSSIGLLPRRQVTDPEGHVAIGPVVPGPYVVRADADGFLPAPAVLLSVEGPDTPLQVLTLAAPGRIEGQVLDEDDRPVPEARVELLAEHLFTVGEGQTRARFAQAAIRAAGSLGVTEGPVPAVPTHDDHKSADLGTSVLADRDGRFSFGLLVPGHYRLQARHGRYARSEPVTIRVAAASTRGGLRLVLRTGHRITGRVRDDNRRPVQGASVRVGDGPVIYTDRRGVFDGGIRRGRQRVVARAPGLAPAQREVVVDDAPVDVEMVLGRARAELHGRVSGGNGEVLADARITLRARDGLSATRVAWTDAMGVYRFEDLPPGAMEVEVDHPEHSPVVERIVLEQDDARAQLDLSLVPGWSLDVEVLVEGSRDPLGGVSVDAGGAHARTDADGRASLHRLSDARVQVTAHAEGFGARSVWVPREGAERRSVRIELSEGGGLRGRIIDYRGDVVPEVEVVVLNVDGERLGRARTDGRGRWSLTGVPAGDVEVRAEPPPARVDELAPTVRSSDVLRGHVTRGVDLRFDRR